VFARAGTLTDVEPLTLSEGWGVLHLFFAVDRSAADADSKASKRVLDAVRSLEADGHQALCFAVLGHKADVGVMALGPDLARLQAFQQELAATPLRLVDSFLSFTELSEYSSSEDDERARLATEEHLVGPAAEAKLAVWRERIEHYQEQRLHPRLPLRRAVCFYPMSKRRDAETNWYSLPFAERKALMAGHARVGRGYAGRVLQLITGATGVDDWEWGVTLLADDPVALKDIVYEMRFDPVSAEYAEFGAFVTGLVGEPADVFASVGLGRA